MQFEILITEWFSPTFRIAFMVWRDNIIDGDRPESTPNDSSNICLRCNTEFESVDQLKEHEILHGLLDDLNAIDYNINPTEINPNTEVIHTRSPSQGEVLFDQK